MSVNESDFRISISGSPLFIIATLLFFLAYFHRVVPTVIAPDLLREFSVSASVLGFIISGYFYGYGISQPIVGLLTDRLGLRRVLSMFAGIATLGIIMSALAPTALWMFIGRLLIGFGSGGAWVPGLKIISLFSKPRRHAFLSGTLSAGGLSGGIIATAPYAVLVEFLGWRTSFFLLGGITCFFAILALIVGSSDVDKMSKGIMRSDTLHRSTSWLSSLKVGFKMPIFWYMAATLFFIDAALMTFQGLWGVPFLVDVYSASRLSASKIIMILAIGFVTSSVFFGYLIDKYENLQGVWFIMGLALASGCFAVLAITPDKLSIIGVGIVCCLIGFALGPLVSIFKITPKIFSPYIYATNMGFLNLFPFLGTLIYQPMSGFIMNSFGVKDTHYSVGAYRLVFLLLSVSLFISVIAAIIIRNHSINLIKVKSKNENRRVTAVSKIR